VDDIMCRSSGAARFPSERAAGEGSILMLFILAIVLARGIFRLRILTVRVALLNLLLLGLLFAQPREESE